LRPPTEPQAQPVTPDMQQPATEPQPQPVSPDVQQPPTQSQPERQQGRAKNASRRKSKPSRVQLKPSSPDMQQARAENAKVEGDLDLMDVPEEHIDHTGKGEAEMMEVGLVGGDGNGEAEIMEIETGGGDGNSEAQRMEVELGGDTPAADRKICKADDCNADISNIYRYHRVNGLCSHHIRSDCFMYKGRKSRFCWKCKK